MTAVDWNPEGIAEDRLFTGRAYATLAGRDSGSVALARLDRQGQPDEWVPLTPAQADRLGLELIRLATIARAESDDPIEYEDGAA